MNNTELNRREWGVFILRVVVGIIFVVHGVHKAVVFGVGGIADYLSVAGIPAPMPAAVILIAAELVCGPALVLGLFTRWLVLPLAFEMLVALLTVHIWSGFFVPEGVEFVLLLLSATIALSLMGSGALSLDGLLARMRRGRGAASGRAEALSGADIRS